MMTATDSERRIYVACLAAYNAGTLHGRWIDADQDAEDIFTEVQEMLAESPEPGAEEWAIHDYEGFGSYKLGEWESFEDVSKIAQGLEEHGDAFTAFLSYVGGLEYADDFDEAYCGRFDSEEDYAQDLAESIGDLPREHHWPHSYIDWERAAHDLFMGDYWSADADEGGVHVFRSI